MTTPQHFVFALVENFHQIALSCGVDPLRIANRMSGEELYTWSLASENGETAQASNGLTLVTQAGYDSLPPCERLFVLSGNDMRQRDHQALIAALRRVDRTTQTKIGGLCSGAYVLAKAGFLDGQEAAMHWEFHEGFVEEFPEVCLRPNVFIADGPYITASGGTATADLMLHLIAQDHGEDLAASVSDQLVYSNAREGTAPQRVSFQSSLGARNRHLARAVQVMRDTLEDPLPPSQIAEMIGVSPRQLERLFNKYLRTSPKKYYLGLRLERARSLLVQTEMSIMETAIACGFQSPGHFSRVYRERFGITPAGQRGKLT